MFPFVETKNWNKIFPRTLKISQKKYLQSSQYKSLNIILNCNDKLYKWKIQTSSECNECAEVDSIEHHMYKCKTSTKFWNQLKKWMVDGLVFGI